MATNHSADKHELNETHLRFQLGQVLQRIQSIDRRDDGQMAAALSTTIRRYKYISSGQASIKLHMAALCVSEFGVSPEYFFANSYLSSPLGLDAIIEPGDLEYLVLFHKLHEDQLEQFLLMIDRLSKGVIRREFHCGQLYIDPEMRDNASRYLTDNQYYRSIGHGLLRFRSSAGLTMSGLADGLGVSISKAKRLLKGDSSYELDLWGKFALGFNVNPIVINDPSSPYSIVRKRVTKRTHLLTKIKSLQPYERRLIWYSLNGILFGTDPADVPESSII